MTQISAIIVADSKALSGDRLTTMSITFPRFILAELNTHRMLSKNSASSRAIPFNKMVKSVQENPFIPIAWQKDHSGMQGNEYEEIDVLISEHRLKWLEAKDSQINIATEMNVMGNITKQLCNRLLEPFMYHTVLISGTEWENFFALRCPQYELNNSIELEGKTFKSKKDLLKFLKDNNFNLAYENLSNYSNLQWLKVNKGQAEIHMMALAEAMWDAMNESVPKELKEGEWHIPYEDKIDFGSNSFISNYSKSLGRDSSDLSTKELDNLAIKISTAMCARTSYTIVGDEKEVSYETLLKIHDRMANQIPFHASPFEHCARVMTRDEYYSNIKGVYNSINERKFQEHFSAKTGFTPISGAINNNALGWCRNYKGFIQYRELLENK